MGPGLITGKSTMQSNADELMNKLTPILAMGGSTLTGLDWLAIAAYFSILLCVAGGWSPGARTPRLTTFWRAAT
jgi:hypothetical protein